MDALGIFFGGLGIFLLSCGLFWFLSLYAQTIEAKKKEKK
jgi:hypothetical protein